MKCQLCGTVEAQDEWMSVFCPPEGLVGTSVTVEKTNGAKFYVCEIEIHGEIIADTETNSLHTSTTTSKDSGLVFG